MSDEIHGEESQEAEEAAEAAEAAEAPVEDPKKAEAMSKMQSAMMSLGPEEKKVIRELMEEVDAALNAPGAPVADKQLEFCYTIKFSQDRLSNGRLLDAAEAYIAAVEG